MAYCLERAVLVLRPNGTMDDFGVYAWPAQLRWPCALPLTKLRRISTIEESRAYTYEQLMCSNV